MMKEICFYHRNYWLLILCCITSCTLKAQSNYDQHVAFDPGFMGQGTMLREGNGRPGPMYWQNRADYTMNVILDTTAHRLSGTVRIHYINNSPDSLHYIWLQLEQNSFKPGSRSSRTTSPAQPRAGATEGYQFENMVVEQDGMTTRPDTVITDARMQVRLKKPLKPKGGTVDLVMKFSFGIHNKGINRMGWIRTANGPLYELAQWYPKVCVYDDVRGWDTLPYLGMGEFYLEYGTFDYKVTVPANMVVAGSGELQNPGDVLTREEQSRLEQAHNSDKTVTIIGKKEVGRSKIRPKEKGKLTWHFRMENTHDVAWAASNAFIWDAARINLPEGKQALAMSFYPEESAGENAYDRSTEMSKRTIEMFSEHWYPYPWPVAINVGGPVGGMEYPGIVFCHHSVTGGTLWMLINHELGHEWFPMIVGSNERRDAWMDEGFNTFIDIYGSEWYHDGEYAPKRDSEYAPKGGNPPDEIVPALTDSSPEPIITLADVLNPKLRHPIAYYKPALGLVMLREYILGPDRFDYAFQTYIRRWAFKHPKPMDFYRTMNDASGEDLMWFWKGWFVNNWLVDQAVTNVSYINDDPENGALITIGNLQKLPMPVEVKVTESDGDTGRTRLPVEIWQRGGRWTFRYDSDQPLKSVTLDPDAQLPDINRDNDTWMAQ